MLTKIALAVNCQGQAQLTEKEQRQPLVILHDNQSAAIVLNTQGYTRLACACCMSELDKEAVRDAIRALPRGMPVAVLSHPSLFVGGFCGKEPDQFEEWSFASDTPAFLVGNLKRWELEQKLFSLHLSQSKYRRLLAQPTPWDFLRQTAERRLEKAKRELRDAEFELKRLDGEQKQEVKQLTDLPGEIAQIPAIEAELASTEYKDLIGE